MSTLTHYLSFRIGSQWYGVNLDNVMEVHYLMALTELPSAPPGVLGLMTVRDQVLPVLDMRVRFGQTDPALKLDTPIITVRRAQGPLGLLVDDVDNVEVISNAQIVNYDGREFKDISKVIKLDDRLLLVIDIDQIRIDVAAVDA